MAPTAPRVRRWRSHVSIIASGGASLAPLPRGFGNDVTPAREHRAMSDGGRDARRALLAGRQGGAFSRAQARELGYPDATITHRVRRGTWTRLHPGVYAGGGGDSTRAQQVWAAVLAAGPGTAVTHESAALLHGAERLPLSPITLTCPHGGHHRIESTFVHQIDDLALHHT